MIAIGSEVREAHGGDSGEGVCDVLEAGNPSCFR